MQDELTIERPAKESLGRIAATRPETHYPEPLPESHYQGTKFGDEFIAAVERAPVEVGPVIVPAPSLSDAIICMIAAAFLMMAAASWPGDGPATPTTMLCLSIAMALVGIKILVSSPDAPNVPYCSGDCAQSDKPCNCQTGKR